MSHPFTPLPALSNKLQVLNPFSGEVDRSYAYDTPESLMAHIEQLKRTQVGWAGLALTDRVARVLGALQYFEHNAEMIAQDICRQMGRPLHHARGEIQGLLERGRYLYSIAETALAAEQLPHKAGFDRSIHHVPYGLIYVISAWNYPLLITINSVVPALIAGNVVLLKHARQTPEIGLHFSRAFADLFSEPLLHSVIITHERSEHVIRQGCVDHVVFTGSVESGQRILAQCAQSVIAPHLELGGKDGVYVDASADLKHAASTVVDGACYNAGQSCCGIERAYVHESIYEDFVAEAVREMSSYCLGDPQQPETTLGPLAMVTNADIMSQQVEDACAAGARCVFGGKVRKMGKGTFFEPTLLVDVPREADVVKTENFGPILAVVSVSDVDDAIAELNASELGLTSAIFTTDLAQADYFFERVHAGTIFMNRCDYLDPALPWTGFKKSGCGSALSHFGFYSVTQRKAKHFRTSLV